MCHMAWSQNFIGLYSQEGSCWVIGYVMLNYSRFFQIAFQKFFASLAPITHAQEMFQTVHILDNIALTNHCNLTYLKLYFLSKGVLYVWKGLP
jgi:hypothetical protein